jgi:adenosylmethionine---8-amino-7-oxononanoate aminotransferase
MTTRDRIVAADKAHVWHPYTPMKPWIEAGEPLVVDRAEGARLFDVDGRSYLDGNSSWWVAALGHRHPRLVRAMKEQADRLVHVTLAGVTHEPAALLAEELVAIAPAGLTRVFYSDNGSTAVEVALKMALQLAHLEGKKKRTRFVALEGAYHGDTIGATSLGGVELFRRPFAGVLFDCAHVPFPGDGAAYEAAFEAIGRAVAGAPDEVAGVVVEPVLQGASGMRIYDPRFLRAARELCDAHDVPLIVDEVFTGYGRTGPMWACDLAGVSPDLLCTAKGFSGGMLPMAATIATERIFRGFDGDALWYGHTYCGHALGAAIAREVLAIYRDEEIVARARPKAAAIRRAFERFADLPGVARTRAIGMVGALDLADDAAYTGGRGWRVFDEAKRRGAYLRPLGDVVYVAPPLNTPDADLDELLAIVEASVRAAG